MKALLQDGKAIIMKKAGVICYCLMSILLISAVIWGQDVYALLQGTTAFSEYEPSVNTTETKSKLKHAYIQTDIEMITGSYAQYGKIKENEMQQKTVYYLMPINNGEYFITIIAHGDITSVLDQMEQAFYNSIGKDEKDYPGKITVTGGFKLLQAEELNLALDYFKNYDKEIKSMEDLNKLCSPYAIVIDQINNITTDSLWTLLWLWIFIFTLFMIVAVLYFSGYFLKPLKNDIRKLSNRTREFIDEDYKQATPIENLKIGTYCLYQNQPFTMRVYEYDNFIWIYQKETIAKKKGCFEVCAYDIQGNQYILWQGDQQKTAEKLAQRIFDRSHHALLGFESFIYEYWKDQPEHLYTKLKELSLINEKIAMEQEKNAISEKKEYHFHNHKSAMHRKHGKEVKRKVRKKGR